MSEITCSATRIGRFLVRVQVREPLRGLTDVPVGPFVRLPHGRGAGSRASDGPRQEVDGRHAERCRDAVEVVDVPRRAARESGRDGLLRDAETFRELALRRLVKGHENPDRPGYRLVGVHAAQRTPTVCVHTTGRTGATRSVVAHHLA